MKTLFAIAGTVVLVVLSIWAWDIISDRQHKIEIVAPTPLYAVEYPLPTSPVIATLPVGEQLKVLRINIGSVRYAKVERADGSTGWVMTGSGAELR